MVDFIATLEQEVERSIREIESTEKNILRRALAVSNMLEDVFDRLKAFVSHYAFGDEQEEITFFKETKPRIFCHLLYYRKVYNIEMNRPMGSDQEQVRYLNCELEQIRQYMFKRLDFYRYIRSGESHLDKEFFLRNKKGGACQYLDSFYFERDPLFSASGDFRVAKILANDMLQQYLRKELEEIRIGKSLVQTPDIKLETPRWTEAKTGLIEVLYAWDAIGCINGGNISLSRMAAYAEQTFDVRLGNITRAFNEMKLRNRPSAFIDRMKEALMKKIDDLEEKNIAENLNRKIIEDKKTD